jgi:hypothetical protein
VRTIATGRSADMTEDQRVADIAAVELSVIHASSSGPPSTGGVA